MTKAQRIADLEKRLARESAMLDQMAHRHPKTYDEVSYVDEWTKSYRPGVAMIEMRKALNTRAQFESECG